MPDNLEQAYRDEAARQGLDPDVTDVLVRHFRQESGLNPMVPDSYKGAIGPSQLMPATARQLGVNPRNVQQNIVGGVKYFKQMYDVDKDPVLAVARYNAGPDNVVKFHGVPPFNETHHHLDVVFGKGWRNGQTKGAASPTSLADLETEITQRLGSGPAAPPQQPAAAGTGGGDTGGSELQKLELELTQKLGSGAARSPAKTSPGAAPAGSQPSPTLHPDPGLPGGGWTEGALVQPEQGGRYHTATGQRLSGARIPGERLPVATPVARPGAAQTRQLFPEEIKQAKQLADHFDTAKARGDFTAMRSIGQALKDQYGYEYGESGGWPYIKAPQSTTVPVDTSPGARLRSEAVGRQLAGQRAQREYEAQLAQRSAPTRVLHGFIDPLAAGVGNIDTAVGQVIDLPNQIARGVSNRIAETVNTRRPAGAPPQEAAIRETQQTPTERLVEGAQDIAQEHERRMAASKDLPSQIGQALGQGAKVVGEAALGGPLAVGALETTERLGRGEPGAESIVKGLLTAGTMEAGGKLAENYAARFANPYAKTLASAGAFETAFRGEHAIEAGLTGEQGPPDNPRQVAFDFLQNLGFGALHARGQIKAEKIRGIQDRIGKMLQPVVDHPDVHPEVKEALDDALNNRINPDAPGNVKASDQKEPISNRVLVRSEDGRLGVIQVGKGGSAQFNEVTNARSARGWMGLQGVTVPAEEFEGIFPQQAEGYQPGTIEQARAQFLKDEGLGPKQQAQQPTTNRAEERRSNQAKVQSLMDTIGQQGLPAGQPPPRVTGAPQPAAPEVPAAAPARPSPTEAQPPAPQTPAGAPGEGVSVPAFIPRNVQQALADLGYPGPVIGLMKPEEAQGILQAQRRYVPGARPPTAQAPAPPSISPEEQASMKQAASVQGWLDKNKEDVTALHQGLGDVRGLGGKGNQGTRQDLIKQAVSDILKAGQTPAFLSVYKRAVQLAGMKPEERANAPLAPARARKVAPDPDLIGLPTETRRVVEGAQQRFAQDPDTLVDQYLNEFGNNGQLSNARKILAPEVRNPDQMTKHGEALTKVAGQLLDRVYDRAIQKAKNVTVMLGATGVGKSTAGEEEAKRPGNFVYESHGEDLPGLIQKLQNALDQPSVEHVTVNGIFREPEVAIRSMLDRFKGGGENQNEKGKVVSLDRAVRTLMDSAKAYDALREHFGNKVDFRGIDNTKDMPRATTDMPHPDEAQVRAQMQAVFDDALKKGDISQDEYDRFVNGPTGRPGAKRLPEVRPEETGGQAQKPGEVPQAPAETAPAAAGGQGELAQPAPAPVPQAEKPQPAQSAIDVLTKQAEQRGTDGRPMRARKGIEKQIGRELTEDEWNQIFTAHEQAGEYAETAKKAAAAQKVQQREAKAAAEKAERERKKSVATIIHQMGGIKPSKEGTAGELRRLRDDLKQPGLTNKNGKNARAIAEELTARGFRMPDGREIDDENDVIELLEREARGEVNRPLDFDYDSQLDQQIANLDPDERQPVQTFREALSSDGELAHLYVKIASGEGTDADESAFYDRARDEHGFPHQEIGEWLDTAKQEAADTRAERGAGGAIPSTEAPPVEEGRGPAENARPAPQDVTDLTEGGKLSPEDLPRFYQATRTAGGTADDAWDQMRQLNNLGFDFKHPGEALAHVRIQEIQAGDRPLVTVAYENKKKGEPIVIGRLPGDNYLFVIDDKGETHSIQNPRGDLGNEAIRYNSISESELASVPQIGWEDLGRRGNPWPHISEVKRVEPTAKSIKDLTDDQVKANFPEYWARAREANQTLQAQDIKPDLVTTAAGTELPTDAPTVIQRAQDDLRSMLTNDRSNPAPAQAVFMAGLVQGHIIYDEGAKGRPEWTKAMKEKFDGPIEDYLDELWLETLNANRPGESGFLSFLRSAPQSPQTGQPSVFGPVPQGRSSAKDVLLDAAHNGYLTVRGAVRIATGLGGRWLGDAIAKGGENLIDQAVSSLTDTPRMAGGYTPSGTLAAMRYGATAGLRGSLEALMGRGNQLRANRPEAKIGLPILDAIMHLPGRIYAAKESPFFYAAYEGARQADARRMALNDLRGGAITKAQLDARIDSYLNNPSAISAANWIIEGERAKALIEFELADNALKKSQVGQRWMQLMGNTSVLMDAKAKRAAAEAIYAQPNAVEQFLDTAETAARRSKNAGVRAIGVGVEVGRAIEAPYMRRPANAVMDLLGLMTGASAAKSTWQLFRKGALDPVARENFARAVSRGMTYWGLFGLGTYMASQGMISGYFGKTQGEQRREEAGGAGPGKLKIGDHYYKISGIPLIGTIPVLAATVYENGPGGWTIPAALVHAALEHPLMRGMENITRQMENAKQVAHGKGLGKAIGETAASEAGRQVARLIPGPLQWAADLMDPYERDLRAQGFTGPIRERIPILYNTLPAKTDYQGRPLEKSMLHFIDPFETKQNLGSKDPVLSELAKYSLGLPGMNRKQGESQADFKARERNQQGLLRERLESVLNSEAYKNPGADVDATALRRQALLRASAEPAKDTFFQRKPREGEAELIVHNARVDLEVKKLLNEVLELPAYKNLREPKNAATLKLLTYYLNEQFSGARAKLSASDLLDEYNRADADLRKITGEPGMPGTSEDLALKAIEKLPANVQNGLAPTGTEKR